MFVVSFSYVEAGGVVLPLKKQNNNKKQNKTKQQPIWAGYVLFLNFFFF